MILCVFFVNEENSEMEQWLSRIRLLDIAGHNQIEPFLKGWYYWVDFVRILIKSVFYAVIFIFIPGVSFKMAIGLAVAYSCITTCTLLMGKITQVMVVAKWLFVIGIVTGIMYFFIENASKKETIEIAAKVFFSGALFIFLLSISSYLLILLDHVFSEIADFINKIPLVIARLIFRNKFPAWTGVVTLMSNGTSLHLNNDERNYVSHPSLRREGLAHQEKIPKFTPYEIQNSRLVNYRMAQWASSFPEKESLVAKYPAALAAAFGAAGVASLVSVGIDLSPDDWLQNMNMVNPMTGLPMMEGGMIDINGNPFGMDISNIGMGMVEDFSHIGHDMGGFNDHM